MATRIGAHEVERDLAATYNAFKEFEGKKYTGMRVGGRHKWYYETGEWNERKVAPDRWEFTYAVPKRRAGRAPPGSGVPVGTGTSSRTRSSASSTRTTTRPR
jgi:hypothetical protein